MQLKAVFLLLILGLAMLHDALPHTHRQYNTHSQHLHSTTSSSSDHHGIHEQGHHHSDEDDPESGGNGFFFDFLLNGHAYLLHTQQVTLHFSNEFKILKVKDAQASILGFNISISGIEVEYLHRYCLFKQACYDNPFLLTNSLRGPPTLG